MPPAAEDATRPAAAAPAPMFVSRPRDKREHLLHLVTYSLVSVAAAVYILTTLVSAVIGGANSPTVVIAPPPPVATPGVPGPVTPPKLVTAPTTRVDKWLGESAPATGAKTDDSAKPNVKP